MTTPKSAGPGDRGWKARLRAWAGPVAGVIVVGAAFYLLRRELKHHGWREIMHAVAAVPRLRIAAAVGLTAINYLVLTGYDILALRYLQRPLPYRRIMLGSFIGYAMSHNLGWILGGSTVRYRFYSLWGLSAVEIVKLLGMLGVTFCSGFCFLAGIVFVFDPLPIPTDLRQLHVPLSSTFWLGPILLSILAAYLVGCAVGKPLAIRGRRLEFPKLPLALMQIGVATTDLLLATASLYVLLPPDVHLGYWSFINVVLVAWAAMLLSHVPGGVGVLELLVVKLVAPKDPTGLIGVLLAFRVIYYLLPLTVSLALFGGHELMAYYNKARRTDASE